MSAPLPERVGRFVAEHEVLAPGEPVLALVSGGADSVCLWDVLRTLGHEVEAVHVEHGLRGAAGLADAAHCAALGAVVVPVDLPDGGNVEARAREARYAAARELAAGRPIATGHTLSDQAETVVYRLASSSGPRALRAMRPRSGELARPLLGVTAEDTRAWCAERSLAVREDETNDDRTIRRNLIRHEVMPLLRRVHPGAERNLARSAELLGELDELLRTLAEEHMERRARPRPPGGAPRGAACDRAAGGRRARRRAPAAADDGADRAAGVAGRAPGRGGTPVAGRRPGGGA